MHKDIVIRSESWREYRGVRIHDEDECSALSAKGKFKAAVYCPFDKPSDHKMVGWPMDIRLDAFARGLVERMCPHGVGHPDPDSVQFMVTASKQRSWGTHGCDGCCGE